MPMTNEEVQKMLDDVRVIRDHVEVLIKQRDALTSDNEFLKYHLETKNDEILKLFQENVDLKEEVRKLTRAIEATSPPISDFDKNDLASAL
jgi:predicted nuclease with TOPRIM domain